MPALAMLGGSPVRSQPIGYSRQWIDEEDISAVLEVLRSDWLTTGPWGSRFERLFADVIGAKEAVAVSHGTAGLHAAMYGLKIQPGDEVIVPAMTFPATANSVVFQGGTPVFADVAPETLLLDAQEAEKKITSRTKAIIAVDYAGQPCDYDALNALAKKHRLMLVADACHSLGGSYRERSVGSLADLTVFSFHPVKSITTGEGGMVTTDRPELAHRMKLFRNHGIAADHRQREEQGSWFYEMTDLGYNYRLSDFQCALGISQMRKLPEFIQKRREIAQRYDQALQNLPGIKPLEARPDRLHAYHLYVIQLDLERFRTNRAEIFKALHAEGIRVNVHYIPVHLHPFYQRRFGTRRGDCPVSEAAYERLLTLPLYPRMIDQDVDDVLRALEKVTSHFWNP